MKIKDIIEDNIMGPLRMKNHITDLRDDAFRTQYGNGVNPDTSFGVLPAAVEQFSKDPVNIQLSTDYFAALSQNNKEELQRLADLIRSKSIAQQTAIAQLVVSEFKKSPASKKIGAKLTL